MRNLFFVMAAAFGAVMVGCDEDGRSSRAVPEYEPVKIELPPSPNVYGKAMNLDNSSYRLELGTRELHGDAD